MLHNYLFLIVNRFVFSIGFLPQRNDCIVFFRVCNTARTHIPIAADSLLRRVGFEIPRGLIVLRTFLIQRQSFPESTLFVKRCFTIYYVYLGFFGNPYKKVLVVEKDGYQSSYPYPR